MRTGVLKLWKREQGFGFIKDDTNGSDIFVHKIAFQVAGIDPDLIVVGT
jgi:cold shock CspA family protein